MIFPPTTLERSSSNPLQVGAWRPAGRGSTGLDYRGADREMGRHPPGGTKRGHHSLMSIASPYPTCGWPFLIEGDEGRG
jgi:hypothetical protein